MNDRRSARVIGRRHLDARVANGDLKVREAVDLEPGQPQQPSVPLLCGTQRAEQHSRCELRRVTQPSAFPCSPCMESTIGHMQGYTKQHCRRLCALSTASSLHVVPANTSAC